jgi:hypothetical protein
VVPEAAVPAEVGRAVEEMDPVAEVLAAVEADMDPELVGPVEVTVLDLVVVVRVVAMVLVRAAHHSMAKLEARLEAEAVREATRETYPLSERALERVEDQLKRHLGLEELAPQWREVRVRVRRRVGLEEAPGRGISLAAKAGPAELRSIPMLQDFGLTRMMRLGYLHRRAEAGQELLERKGRELD